MEKQPKTWWDKVAEMARTGPVLVSDFGEGEAAIEAAIAFGEATGRPVRLPWVTLRLDLSSTG